MFVGCRWEVMNGATARIRHRATSAAVRIRGGYDSWKIVEVVDAGGNPGIIDDGVGGFYRQSNTAGQTIPTAVNTVLTGWPTTGLNKITYDGAGNFTPRAGTWAIRARATFANNAAGQRKILLACNGSTVDVDEKPGTATTSTQRVEATFKFDGAQTFNISAYQNSGADLALQTTSPYVKLEAEYKGY
jgi:hypothetical protein